jgi:hypothetical protein
VIAPSWVTSSTGAFHASSLLETVGVAKVDGFYRFPSFESCKAERCQRDYSARKATPLKSKLTKEHVMPSARRSLWFCAAAAALLARGGCHTTAMDRPIQCDSFGAPVNWRSLRWIELPGGLQRFRPESVPSSGIRCPYLLLQTHSGSATSYRWLRRMPS